ncbi:hypothetical protein NC652_028932 [Populus alba x Populus x berolinensis]|nr:hypothetical protein NC652_028932 [Populus alba x Populus x berolinensis]
MSRERSAAAWELTDSKRKKKRTREIDLHLALDKRISRTTGTARNWFLAILVKILVYYVQDLAVKFAHEYMLAVKFAHEYFYREFHQVFLNNENELHN